MHCKRTRPIVEQFKVETGIEITELEVWHNDKNAQLLRKYGSVISKACGGELGVPSFYNERNGKAICGIITIDQLKAWAST